MKPLKLSRKIKFSSQSAGFVVVLVVLLILVNIVSVRYFSRLDLTSDQQYTLSPASQNFIRELNDVLSVKAYFTSELPPELLVTSQYVKDILEEYQTLSPYMTLEVRDPASDPAIEAEATSAGIPQVQVNVYEQDRFEVKNAYLGVAFSYAGRTEIIPFISSIDSLEYQISSTLKKVTSDETKTIGFLTGHNGANIYEPPFAEAAQRDGTLVAVRQALEQIYTVEAVGVQSGTPISDEIDTLVIPGPKSAFSSRELYEFDQFITRGGNVIFLINPIHFGVTIDALEIDTNLDGLLENVGLRANKDLVMDASNELVSFSVGNNNRAFLAPYPFWVKTVPQFYGDSPVVNRLGSVVFPWVSSVDLVEQEGVSGEIFMDTTTQASKMVTPYNVDPQQDLGVQNFHDQFHLVAFTRGTFKGMFAGQHPPLTEDEEAGKAEPNEEWMARVGRVQSTASSNMVLIGDADFIHDQTLERFPDNLAFFLNLVDYVTLDESLIEIRAKTLTDRPIEQLDEKEKNKIRFINTFAIPGLVVIGGIARTISRRKKRAL